MNAVFDLMNLVFFLIRKAMVSIFNTVILIYPFPECPVSDVPSGDIKVLFPAIVEASVR